MSPGTDSTTKVIQVTIQYIWETSILSYLFTHNKDVCTEILPRGEKADHKDHAEHNRRDFVEPAQVQDGSFLQLFISDASRNLGFLLTILRKHYQYAKKPRFLSLENYGVYRLYNTVNAVHSNT